MATYRQITEWVLREKGIKINHTCWIAHCKAIATGKPDPDLNERGTPRVVPCPVGPARISIFEAFEAIGIPKDKRTVRYETGAA